MLAAAARSVLRSTSVRSGAARLGSGAKSASSPFRMSTRKPPSNRIFGCPVEMSSMQPFHTATASALMTSMLTLSRVGYGWLPEGCGFKNFGMSQMPALNYFRNSIKIVPQFSSVQASTRLDEDGDAS